MVCFDSSSATLCYMYTVDRGTEYNIKKTTKNNLPEAFSALTNYYFKIDHIIVYSAICGMRKNIE